MLSVYSHSFGPSPSPLSSTASSSSALAIAVSNRLVIEKTSVRSARALARQRPMLVEIWRVSAAASRSRSSPCYLSFVGVKLRARACARALASAVCARAPRSSKSNFSTVALNSLDSARQRALRSLARFALQHSPPQSSPRPPSRSSRCTLHVATTRADARLQCFFRLASSCRRRVVRRPTAAFSP